MANLKTITEVDVTNFPQVAEFVGQVITPTEWYKAINGEKFTVGSPDEAEKAEATDVDEALVKKVAKKSK
jgi:hypothetical protein